jgi:hypothetical protein
VGWHPKTTTIRCFGNKLKQEAANGKGDDAPRRRSIGAIADKYGPRQQLLLRHVLWLAQASNAKSEELEQDDDDDGDVDNDDKDDHHLN